MDDPLSPLPPRIDVVAGVITDARGRILLARRTAGRDLAGLWEFPGGKVEAGESPEAALVRELGEELGIRAQVGAPLIAVSHAYAHKRLRLDVRHVRSWRGPPRGREGQALAWVAADKLARYAMPAADRPVVAALLQPDRCLVTPPPQGDDDASDAAWLDSLSAALAAGIRRVQLRLPALAPGRVQRLVTLAADACRDAGADVVLNAGVAGFAAPAGDAAGFATALGDAAGSSTAVSDAASPDLQAAVDLAQGAGIGLHLSSRLLRMCMERPVPADVRLSASCHDADELRQADALGCDYALLGPVAPTPSHPGAPGIGWTAFDAIREVAAIPVYAIGGLGPDDLVTARHHGAQGVAGISAFWPRKDVPPRA